MGIVKRQSIKNTIIVYAGIIIGFISLLIVQPAYLSKDEIGLTRLIISFATLFSSVCAFGISNLTVKFFPYFKNYDGRHNGFFGLTILIPVVGSVIGCLILFPFKEQIIAHYSAGSQIFVSFFYQTFLLSLIFSLNYGLNSYCYALLKTTVPSFLNDVVTRVVYIALMMMYGFGLLSFNQFVLLIVLSYILQTILLLVYIIYYGNPSFRINRSILKEIGFFTVFKYGATLTLTSMTALALKFLDMIMIGHYKSDADVGVYSIAVFIALLIETPLNSMERIAGPKMAHSLADNNIGEVQTVYYQSCKYLTIVGGLLTILIVLNVNDLLLMLPNDFSGGINVTIIICIGAFINMATGVNFPILLNSKKYYWGSIFVACMLVTSVVLNALLIPVYGITGAAIATTVSSVVFNALKYLFILKEFKMQPFQRPFFKTLLITGVSLFIGCWIPKTENHLLNIVLNGCVVTCLFLIFLRLLNVVPEFHKYFSFRSRKE